MLRQLVAGLTLGVFIASCSAGGQAPALGPGMLPNAARPETLSGTPTGTVKVTIVVPKAAALAPHYVSPSTRSIVVKAYSAHKKLLASKTVKLAAGAKGCKSGAKGLTCTFMFTVAAGKDRFSATTYDGFKGRGKALSVLSNFVRRVRAGKTVKLPLALAGIPHSVTMEQVDDSEFATGDSASGFQFAGLIPHTMQLTALDADGNIIAGKGAATLALGSSDSATVGISAVPGTTNDFLISPHADASSITLTAAAKGSYKGATTVSLVANLSIGSALYVANYDTVTPGGNITVYAPWSATPIQTISTGTNNPAMLFVDGSGNLWVANDAGGTTGTGTIAEYAPGITTPSRTITGLTNPNTGGGESLAVDKSGNLYCACNNAAEVDEFTPTGGSTPSRALTAGASPTGINNPYSVVTDASGNVYVANYGSNTVGISEFGPTGTTPTRNITSGINGVWLVAIDKAGNIYGGNYSPTPNTITEYAPGGSTPIKTYGSTSGIASIYALGVDALGNVYAGNYMTTTTANATQFTSATYATPARTLPLPNAAPFAVATDPFGNVYIPVTNTNNVLVYPPGTSTTPIRTLTTTNGINNPWYVATWP